MPVNKISISKKGSFTKLKGKTVIVTGADSGISKAIALKYLEEDIKCVLVDLKNLHKLHLLLEDQFITLTADISKKEDIQQILSTTLQNFNKVDILFNSAGIFDMRPLLD